MSTLLLHAVEARAVPFSHIPEGGVFEFQGRFFARFSLTDARPLSRRQGDPIFQMFAGAMVHEVNALDGDRFFVTEYLERKPEGTTANRMPVGEWPAWAADLQRELFPVTPRPAILRGPETLQDASARLNEAWRNIWVPFSAGFIGAWADLLELIGHPINKIKELVATLKPPPSGGVIPTHDWICPTCLHWNPDLRKDRWDETCRACSTYRPAICTYRKHKP